MRPVERPRQRPMKDRHQRRALPAGRHIGRAEIVGDRKAEPLGERRARRRSARSAGARAGAARSGRESRPPRHVAGSMPLCGEEGDTASAWTRVTKASASASTPGRSVRFGQRACLRQARAAAAPRSASRIGAVGRSARSRRSLRRRSRSARHRRHRARCRSSARSRADLPTPCPVRLNPPANLLHHRRNCSAISVPRLRK